MRNAFLRCLAVTILSGAGASSAVGQAAPASGEPAVGGSGSQADPLATEADHRSDNLSEGGPIDVDPADTGGLQDEPPAQPAPEPATKVHPSRAVSRAVGVRGSGACVDRAVLHDQVARWLERDTVDNRIGVEVVFGPGDQDVRFRVHRKHGEPSERELEGLPEACDALLSAAGLSIALAIDAAILEELRVPDDDELVEVKARPGLLAGLRPTEQPHHFSLALGLAGGLSTGLLTATAPVAMVNLHGLVTPWLELRLGGLFASVSGQNLPELSDVQYRASVWVGRADACAHVALTDWLAALGCAGVQGGLFITEASGQRLQGAEATARPLWAIGLGLGMRASISSLLELAVAVDLSLPLADRVIQVDDVGGEPLDQRTLQPAGMLVSAGPVFRFF